MRIRDPIPARLYFRRSGRMFIVAATVVAIVGAIFAPDLLGRVIAAIVVALLLGLGVQRLNRARSVSEKALVRETVSGSRVGYILDEPE